MKNLLFDLILVLQDSNATFHQLFDQGFTRLKSSQSHSDERIVSFHRLEIRPTDIQFDFILFEITILR